jgi:hypothetical protein
MLKPQDIFAVAAHEDKEGISICSKAAKKVGISPERMNFILMVKEYSDPRLIRIRAGNTLFTIAAFPDGIGFVRGYNGDTAPNYIANMIELNMAARRMGFKALLAHGSPAVMKAIKLALRQRKIDDTVVQFDHEQGLVAVAMKRA